MSRSRSVSIALATALVAALVPIRASVAVAAPSWVVTQVSSWYETHGRHVGTPQVSGDRAVWVEDSPYYSPQVFTQRIGTDVAAIQLTPGDNSGSGNDPQVSGDRVVWQGYDSAGCSQIFTQKVGIDAAPRQLSSGTSGNSGPQVSGDRVVWVSNDRLGSSQIFTQKVGIDVAPVGRPHSQYRCLS